MNNGSQMILENRNNSNSNQNENENYQNDNLSENVYLTQWQHSLNKKIWECFYPIWKSSCFK